MRVSVSERIARRRRFEQRSAMQLVVYRALSKLKPNQDTNIRCPWKHDPFVMRAWCPFHAWGEWVRLVVRTDDGGHTTFECERGCSHHDVNSLVNAIAESGGADLPAQTDDGARRVTGASPSGVHQQNGRGVQRVLDARHRFPSYPKKSGQLNTSFHDDPAA